MIFFRSHLNLSIVCEPESNNNNKVHLYQVQWPAKFHQMILIAEAFWDTCDLWFCVTYFYPVASLSQWDIDDYDWWGAEKL